MNKWKPYFTLCNALTATRLVGAVVLLFLTPLKTAFYIVYTICGLTDILDGFVARKTKTASTFGAKLDSVADLTFYTVMMIRLIPELFAALTSVYVWVCVGIILAVRIAAYIVTAIRFHRFASNHTYLNKATGALVFLVPFFIRAQFFLQYAYLVSAVAFAASAYELITVLRRPKLK